MIRYIIVDDDPSTLAFVKQKVDGIATDYDLKCTGSFSSSKKAFESICQDSFDLLIVDFEMPIYNGVELAQRVGVGKDIIFLTSTVNNEKHIINSVNIVGYLSKPFDIEEFESILKNKVICKPLTKEHPVIPEVYTVIEGVNKDYQLRLQDVYYISTSRNLKGEQPKPNHLHIYGNGDSPIFKNVRKTISGLAEDLQSYGFVKINQSTIVNGQHIKTRDNVHLSLFDTEESFIVTGSLKSKVAEFLRQIRKMH